MTTRPPPRLDSELDLFCPNFFRSRGHSVPVFPLLQCDQIYWTFGNFSKPLTTINLPKSPTFSGNFCKGAKPLIFSSCFWAIFIDIWRFFTGHTGCNRMFFHFIIIIITTILWVLWFSTGMDLPQRSLIEGDVAQGVSYGVY